MKTILVLCTMLSLTSVGNAQSYNIFTGNYQGFMGTGVTISNYENYLTGSPSVDKFYYPMQLYVSKSGKIRGSATAVYRDGSGVESTTPETVTFSGKLTKLKKNSLYQTATMKCFGSDGSRLAGQIIFEKSRFGLSAKRNLAFEMVLQEFQGSAIFVR